MKYIITESKLDRVIFRYLDMKLDGIELKKGKFADIVFVFPGEEYGLMGWKNHDKLLWSYYKVVTDIEDMFSMRESDALDVIGRYVESRYNLKVNSSDWESDFFFQVKVDN
jgi:hypothetical protein